MKIPQATSSLTNLLKTPSYKVTLFCQALSSSWLHADWPLGKTLPLEGTHPLDTTFHRRWEGRSKILMWHQKWQDRKENAVILSTVSAEPSALYAYFKYFGNDFYICYYSSTFTFEKWNAQTLHCDECVICRSLCLSEGKNPPQLDPICLKKKNSM